MALLGYSARIIVSSENISQSLQSWTGLGFEVQGESAGRVRLTDGQVLLTLMSDNCSSPSLAYSHTDVASLMKDLSDAGIDASDCSPTSGGTMSTVCIAAPECGIIYVHEESNPTIALASKEQSPMLGYFDALVIGVSDVNNVKNWAERAGYFLQEERRVPFPQADVTDGLVTLSFREMTPRRFLSYCTDIDRAYLDEIDRVCREAAIQCNIINTDIIKLTMPEGTVIMISNDLISERGI